MKHIISRSDICHIYYKQHAESPISRDFAGFDGKSKILQSRITISMLNTKHTFVVSVAGVEYYVGNDIDKAIAAYNKW